MPREYKPRCCKDKALAVALFEEPRTPISKRRKKPTTSVKGKLSDSEATNKTVEVISTPHPEGRTLKRKNRVSVRLNGYICSLDNYCWSNVVVYHCVS